MSTSCERLVEWAKEVTRSHSAVITFLYGSLPPASRAEGSVQIYFPRNFHFKAVLRFTCKSSVFVRYILQSIGTLLNQRRQDKGQRQRNKHKRGKEKAV